jgi:hypothetical protein
MALQQVFNKLHLRAGRMLISQNKDVLLCHRTRYLASDLRWESGGEKGLELFGSQPSPSSRVLILKFKYLLWLFKRDYCLPRIIIIFIWSIFQVFNADPSLRTSACVASLFHFSGFYFHSTFCVSVCFSLFWFFTEIWRRDSGRECRYWVLEGEIVREIVKKVNERLERNFSANILMPLARCVPSSEILNRCGGKNV